jgi:hypothetical protein
MKPKVGVRILDMLVDNPHITIFWIILVIDMTREALGSTLFPSRYSEFS